ncbi:MAG TPA: CAP domain-containing protein [Candidatus Elarobacter sp.]|nr:CAP domain-containing protein [Candidatus Elarobacter sp.]
MKTAVLVSAALLALTPLSAMRTAQPAPPRLVLSSEVTGMTAIHIPLVNPHYPVDEAADANTLAADVNAERAKRGLPTLQRDETLDRFAYAKAVEMAARGYFGHTDTNGITFQDRLRTWRWPTTYAAENIAFDWDEPHAHSAFMNSPPHAQNLLDPTERKIGVAVVNVGDKETFYVEDFSAK